MAWLPASALPDANIYGPDLCQYHRIAELFVADFVAQSIQVQFSVIDDLRPPGRCGYSCGITCMAKQPWLVFEGRAGPCLGAGPRNAQQPETASWGTHSSTTSLDERSPRPSVPDRTIARISTSGPRFAALLIRFMKSRNSPRMMSSYAESDLMILPECGRQRYV